MRKNLWLNVIPMVDVDGVVEGAYGKRRPPADYGESWSDDSPYDSVRVILQAIEESSTKVPYSLFIDIHSPTPKDGHYCYAVEPEYSSKHYRRDLSRFCQILSHHALQDSPFPPNSVRYLREGCQYTFHNQYLTYGVLALCLEISYHQTDSGDYVTPDSLRRFGASLGKAIVEFLR